jgi:hypothetical protein
LDFVKPTEIVIEAWALRFALSRLREEVAEKEKRNHSGCVKQRSEQAPALQSVDVPATDERAMALNRSKICVLYKMNTYSRSLAYKAGNARRVFKMKLNRLLS